MAEKKKYRRSNGEGSIFRRSNGKWCGQIGLGYDINGIRKRKTVFGSTRAEVAKKLIELCLSIQKFSKRSPKSLAVVSTNIL